MNSGENLGTIHYFSSFYNEFIARELGWICHNLREMDSILIEKILDSKGKIVVAIGSNYAELDLLREFSKIPLYIHLYADETYDPGLTFQLLTLKNVKKIIRSYPIPSKNFLKIQILFFYSLFINFPLWINCRWKLLLPSLVRTQVFIVRQQVVKYLHVLFRKESISILVGYTNLFAQSICKIFPNLDEKDSLLNKVDNTLVAAYSRKIKMNFMGQSGSVFRESVINAARKVFLPESSLFNIRMGFGGTLGANNSTPDTGEEYARLLMNSDMTLCPPGNYSSFTFRQIEAIVCGSIPVSIRTFVNDPGVDAHMGTQPYMKYFSWISLFHFLQSISKRDLQRSLGEYRKNISNSLRSTNDRINELRQNKY